MLRTELDGEFANAGMRERAQFVRLPVIPKDSGLFFRTGGVIREPPNPPRAVNASTPMPTVLPAPPCEVSRWFADEIRPHEPALRSYLRGRFPDLHELDDVVQETYIRVLRVKEQGTVRSPKSLLFVTGRNVAFDVFRKRSATPEDALANIESLPVIELGNGPAEALARKQELRLLDEAVNSLPAKCRQIIMLHKFEGLSYEEIEQRLGITRNTISAQITIGVMKCRDYLQAHGVTRWKRP